MVRGSYGCGGCDDGADRKSYPKDPYNDLTSRAGIEVHLACPRFMRLIKGGARYTLQMHRSTSAEAFSTTEMFHSAHHGHGGTHFNSKPICRCARLVILMHSRSKISISRSSVPVA